VFNKMLNIVKYDWLRRWKFFLAGLVLFAVVNVDLVVRLIIDGEPSLFSGILIGALFIMVGILIFDHLLRLFKPLFTDESTFVFSTPVNGYNYLGGKLLAVALECVGVALFVALVSSIDYLVLRMHFAPLQMSADFPLHLILTRGSQLGSLMLLGYLSFILSAYLSMALAKSIFSSAKYGGLMAFVFFIFITQVLPPLAMVLGAGRINHVIVDLETTGFVGFWTISIAFTALTVAMLFAATGYLLDRRVNVG